MYSSSVLKKECMPFNSGQLRAIHFSLEGTVLSVLFTIFFFIIFESVLTIDILKCEYGIKP